MPIRRLSKERIEVNLQESAMPCLLMPVLSAYHNLQVEKATTTPSAELFGLLWGHLQYDPELDKPRIVITQVTIDAEAVMEDDGLTPSNHSLFAHLELMKRFWPELSLVGTFHAHSDDKTTEASNRYHAALSDKQFYTKVHGWFQPIFPSMAHLVLTIHTMAATPIGQMSSAKRAHGGYQLNIDHQKIWMRCYSTHQSQQGQQPITRMANLRAPALIERFQADN